MQTTENDTRQKLCRKIFCQTMPCFALLGRVNALPYPWFAILSASCLRDPTSLPCHHHFKENLPAGWFNNDNEGAGQDDDEEEDYDGGGGDYDWEDFGGCDNDDKEGYGSGGGDNDDDDGVEEITVGWFDFDEDGNGWWCLCLGVIDIRNVFFFAISFVL